MKLIFVLKLFICIGIIQIFLISVVNAELIDVGPDYEVSGSGNTYTLTEYSNYVYYPEEGGEYFGKWEKVNESFDIGNCQTGFWYCQQKKNYYKSNFKPFSNEEKLLGWEKNGESVYMELAGLEYDGQSFNIPQVLGEYDNNIIRYYLYDFLWIEYIYLPNMLKEKIYIDHESIKKKNFKGFKFKIKKTDSSMYALVGNWFIICDNSTTYCSQFNTYEEGNFIYVNFSAIDWFGFPDAELPFFVDPVISLNASNVSWDGGVHYTTSVPPTYNRLFGDNLGEIRLGPCSHRSSSPCNSKSRRSDIDYNTSYFSYIDTTNLDIINITLRTVVKQEPLCTPGPCQDRFMNISHMEGNNGTYPDTDGYINGGNKRFWQDMENGTKYLLQYNVTKGEMGTGEEIFYLNNDAWSDLENKVKVGDYNFSLGFRMYPEVDNINKNEQPLKFYSAFDSTASNRHYMNITFTLEPGTCIPANGQLNKTCYFINDSVTVDPPNNLTIFSNGTIILQNSTINITKITYMVGKSKKWVMNESSKRIFDEV